METNPEDWREYPYLVAWVEEMNRWATDNKIYEFVPADEDGLDPTGRIPNSRLTEAENEGTLDERFIWTFEDSGGSDGRLITTDFSSGQWMVRGWYLAEIPHDGERVVYPAGKLACLKCEGESLFETPDGEFVECDLCEAGETSVFVELEETSFTFGASSRSDG